MCNGNRKNKIYGNYLVKAPNGSEMFLCTEKRANWYLDRNLAKKIEDRVLILTFEPKGYGADGDGYLLASKKNACVVCGTTDLEVLTKHHIVPLEYRKLFPEELKSRNSHDVVVICTEHHRVYENEHAIFLKRKLAEQYNAPIHKTQADPYVTAIKAAGILIRNKNKIPKKRKEELSLVIFRGTLEPNITDEFILKLANINLKDYISNIKKHSEAVMDQITDLQGFTEMWRQDFVDNMNPQFMPEYWDVHRTL